MVPFGFRDPWREPAPSGPRVLPVSSYLWCFGISPDGERALTLDPMNGTAVLSDTVKLRPTEALAFAGTDNSAVAWSPDRTTLATGDKLGNVRIWDLASRREVTHGVVPGYWIGVLRFSYDGRFLGCGAARLEPPEDRLGRFWQVDGMREIRLPREADNNCLYADFLPGRGFLAVLQLRRALDVWNWRSAGGRPASQPLTGSKTTVGVAVFTQRANLGFLHAEGRAVFVGGRRTTSPLRHLSQHPGAVVSRLCRGWHAASGQRETLFGRGPALRSSATTRCVAALPGESDTYWNVGMSADNSTVFAVGSERVLLWRAPSWAEIEAAENGPKPP